MHTTPSTPRSAERLSALARVAELLRTSRPTRDTLHSVLAVMPELIPAQGYAIWRYDTRAAEWHILASAGLSRDYISHTVPERPDIQRLLKDPFAIPDVYAWPLAADRLAFYETEGICAMYVLPLHFAGEASGSLVCYFREAREVSAEEEQIARVLADIVSAAISERKFERLADAARVVSAELDVHRLVQVVTDAATEMSNAQFGAFFYNVVDRGGESYTLYTISGVPREKFSQFPMPRNTEVFAPTFNGTATVRSADIRKDPRYGKNAPYHGMPKGHLPVVSYLAVPVVSRSGEVLGGLFFGHSEEGVFTENEEQIVEALAGQAAVGIDNARLYDALTHSEARYKSLVLASPNRQAIWTTAPDGRITEDLSQWRELTGQSFEQMRDFGWLNALHRDDRQRAADAWKEAVETGESFHTRYRLCTRDGGYRWFESRGVPVLHANGSIVEWVGTAVDVHDQKIAEDHLRLLAEASDLLASSLDYETTLKTIAQLAVGAFADWCAVDIVDEDGVGYHRLAVAHVDPAKVQLAHEVQERYPPKTDAVARVIASGKTEWLAEIPDSMIEAAAYDDEHLQILRDIGLLSYILVPLVSHGRVLGTLTLVTSPESGRRFGEADVRLAEELARRAAVAIENAKLFRAANDANRAKDEFLATLSHELRTPMTAVVGWARMMKMGLGEAETREAIDSIEKSATVQMQLIEDILDMSRIMAGKMAMEPSPVDLRTITEAALSAVRPTAEVKGIEILTSFPPQLPFVLGDGNRLQQVIWNLLANAIKFTGRNGSILVRITRGEKTVTAMVRDTGTGIDPAFLPHVFERFRQQDSSTTRAHGGIGIGLAIARYLVEMHGGTISAESEGLGRGATFRVELPVMEARTSAPAAGTLSPAPAAGDNTLPSLHGLSVLIIDDESMTREVIAVMLRRCRASVAVAASAAEGHARVAERRPDVIVCDIAMPDEDGYAFLRQLRSAGGPRIPVLALTAFGRPDDRNRALEAGFDAYLKKPVDPVTLANTVKEVSGR
ncbi:MAG TPA: GAF domain-containing protein [Thermoanaerobaculia bacterium]